MNEHITDQITAWLQANPCGLTLAEALAKFGSTPIGMRNRINRMRSDGRLIAINEGSATCNNRLRLYAPEHAPAIVEPTKVATKPAKSPRVSMTPAERKERQREREREKKRRQRERLGIVRNISIAKPAAQLRGAALVGEPIITAETRVTIAETPKPRFYVEHAPSVFGPVGSYIASDTHLSRVYGDAR